MRADRNLAAGANLQSHATTGRRISGLVTAVTPPAVVQSGFVVLGTPPQTITFPAHVTAGNLLLAFNVGDSNATLTVSDTLTNAWTGVAYSNSVNTAASEIFWAKANASAACTVTLNATGNHAWGLIYEISGIASLTPVDQSAQNQNGGSAPVTGPTLPTLVGSNDFVCYWSAFNTPNSTPAGGIWTNDFRATIGGSDFTSLTYAVTGPTVTPPLIANGQSSGFCISAAAFHP